MRSVLEERFPERQFTIDSAGTNGYHTGEAPDARSIAVAARHGVDISAQRCRQLTTDDFNQFDLILGMDQNNVMAINRHAPSQAKAVVGLFTAVARDGIHTDIADRGVEILDPYYGGAAGFDKTYRMIREAAEALAEKL